MKKASKILSVIVSAMMCVICMTMPVNALTIDSSAKKQAEAIKPGKEYKNYLNSGEEKYYKISLTEKGKLSWDIDFEFPAFTLAVFDSSGKELCSEYAKGNSRDDYDGEIKGSFILEKGTYYVLLKRGTDKITRCSGEIEFEFYFTASSAVTSENNSASSSEGIIALYLEEGDDLYIGALIGGKEADALKFKSSNEKVATVSSRGKLKAVKKGQAIITVTSGSKQVKLAVIVEEDD